MAINNYPGLIAAIQEFQGRADLTTAKVDHFIDLAENYFNSNLRTHEMETTNGSFTVSSGQISNPSDLLQWKRLTSSTGGTTKLLGPLTSEQAAMIDDGTTGEPAYYYVRGDKTLLVPTPDSAAYTIAGTYYQKIPALSDSQSANWITTNYADAYFYPVMAMAEAFIKNDMRLQVWEPLLRQAVDGIQRTSRNKGFGQVGVMVTEYPVY